MIKLSWQLSFALILSLISYQAISDEETCESVTNCLRLIEVPSTLVINLNPPCEATIATPEATEDVVTESTNESEGPANWKVALFGLGLAPAQYMLSNVLHEGSHAVMIKAFGGEVTAFRPYPHTIDGDFYFASVSWRNGENVITPGQRAWILAAPMIWDTAVLGTYSALSATRNLPENKFFRMGLIVFATGHWIDMANHVISRSDYTDSARLRRYFQEHHGMNELESNLATRGPQLAVMAVSGAFIARDLVELFRDNPDPSRRTRVRESMIPGVYNLEVMPSASPSFTGFTFSGSF